MPPREWPIYPAKTLVLTEFGQCPGAGGSHREVVVVSGPAQDVIIAEDRNELL